MGQSQSRCFGGKQLLAAASAGDGPALMAILSSSPGTSCYASCVDRSSPLIVAAAGGHARLVQAILEAAVLSQGLARAKERCINHTTSKGHSALMVACINGHAACVEALVCNGASPLQLDCGRHNSALHWAAGCCRADCVARLLGSGAMFQMQSGQLVAIADIPCFDEDNATLVKLVDRHNGHGFTALHLAAAKGSTSTVRALLRHGATLSCRTTAPKLLANCPRRLQPAGSTPLHIAAAAEELSMVVVLLEAQLARGEPDMRRATNRQGRRPLDSAPEDASPLLLQLLDPGQSLGLNPSPRGGGLVLNPGTSSSRVVPRDSLRLHHHHQPPHLQGLLGLSLVAGGGGAGPYHHRRRRGSVNSSDQPPHVVLGGLLQRLKLVLTLEAVALQGVLDAADAAASSRLLLKRQLAKHTATAAARDGDEGEGPAAGDAIGTGRADAGAASATDAARSTSRPVLGSSPFLSPSSSCSGLIAASDDTAPQADKGGQQQAAAAAALLASQRVRVHSLQQLMVIVDAMMLLLPASATGDSAALDVQRSQSSPAVVAAPVRGEQQQHGQRSSSVSGISAAGSPIGHWGLLGTLLGASGDGPNVSSTSSRAHTGLLGRLRHSHSGSSRRGSSRSSRRGSNAAAAGAAGSEAAAPQSDDNSGPVSEDVLAAFITPSTLSSLAAATKLLVGASRLSGKQQQTQGAEALWDEQEHALALMRSILQSAHGSLKAAQQAAAAAASRSVLRERQQAQIATLMGVGPSGDGARRLPLGLTPTHDLRGSSSRHRGEQNRRRFGGSSTNTIGTPASTAALFAAGSSVGLGAVDGGLGFSALSAAAARASNGGVPRHHRHHHHHSRRQRRSSGGGTSSGGGGADEASTGRQLQQQQQSRHRSSSRSGRPHATNPGDLLDTHAAAGAAVVTAAASSLSAAATATSAAAAQQHQQYMQRLQEILAPVAPASAPPAAAASAAVTAVAAAPEAARGAAGATTEISLASASSSDDSDSDSGATGDDGASLPRRHLSDDYASAAAAAAAALGVASTASSDDEDDDGEADAASPSAAGAGGAAASMCSSLDATTCAICMDGTAGVAVGRCAHALCLSCAYQLCYKANGLPLCPFCRQQIDTFSPTDAAANELQR